jgi:hypothetical protein
MVIDKAHILKALHRAESMLAEGYTAESVRAVLGSTINMIESAGNISVQFNPEVYERDTLKNYKITDTEGFIGLRPRSNITSMRKKRHHV